MVVMSLPNAPRPFHMGVPSHLEWTGMLPKRCQDLVLWLKLLSPLTGTNSKATHFLSFFGLNTLKGSAEALTAD